MGTLSAFRPYSFATAAFTDCAINMGRTVLYSVIKVQSEKVSGRRVNFFEYL